MNSKFKSLATELSQISEAFECKIKNCRNKKRKVELSVILAEIDQKLTEVKTIIETHKSQGFI